MQETLELFKPVPRAQNTIQKWLRWLLGTFLAYGAFILAAVAWYLYNWYIGLSILLLAYLVIGILSSKIIHLAIPPVQREFAYSPYEIASWYLGYLFIPISDDEDESL